LLINNEVVGEGNNILALLTNQGGFDFDKPGNTRDVKWIGDVQDGVRHLVHSLQWDEELKTLMAQPLSSL
jgi:hypothetical protein